MSRWGNSCSQEEETLDLVNLFISKNNGVQLLQTKNFQSEVKNQNTKFTQLIIEPKNRHLLYDLIDIATNPTGFMKKTNTVIDNTLTHSAIQTLTSLTQEFMECVFENKESKDDEVIQTEEEYPILNYILKAVAEKGAEQTGLAYLVKLISPFIYQKPEEMIKIISGQNSKHFLQYFYSRSICELLTKFLEVESQTNFFETQKINLVHVVCEFVKQEINENASQSVMENFGEFIQCLVQKHEDQYERAKYIGFINRIVGQSKYFVFLISEIEHFNNNCAIKTQFLHCIEAFLRIHMPIKQSNKKSEENEPDQKKLQISEPFLTSLIAYLSQHTPNTFNSQIRQQLLNYYKVVKAIIIIEPSAVTNVVNQAFFQQTLQLMQKDPENNILHNIQKDIILSDLLYHPQIIKILQESSQLLVLLKKYLTSQNSNISFESQLFLIGEAVKPKISQKIQNGWNQIEQTLQNKRKFYQTQIGGDPRKIKDKWSDFQDQIFDKVVENKAEKNIKEGNGVRVFNNISRAPTDLFNLEGAEVLSNQFDEPLQPSPLIDDFFSDVSFQPSFNLSGQAFFGGETRQTNFFYTKGESIYLIPAREQIQINLRGKYNLKLNINRL